MSDRSASSQLVAQLDMMSHDLRVQMRQQHRRFEQFDRRRRGNREEHLKSLLKNHKLEKASRKQIELTNSAMLRLATQRRGMGSGLSKSMSELSVSTTPTKYYPRSLKRREKRIAKQNERQQSMEARSQAREIRKLNECLSANQCKRPVSAAEMWSPRTDFGGRPRSSSALSTASRSTVNTLATTPIVSREPISVQTSESAMKYSYATEHVTEILDHLEMIGEEAVARARASGNKKDKPLLSYSSIRQRSISNLSARTIDSSPATKMSSSMGMKKANNDTGSRSTVMSRGVKKAVEQLGDLGGFLAKLNAISDQRVDPETNIHATKDTALVRNVDEINEMLNKTRAKVWADDEFRRQYMQLASDHGLFPVKRSLQRARSEFKERVTLSRYDFEKSVIQNATEAYSNASVSSSEYHKKMLEKKKQKDQQLELERQTSARSSMYMDDVDDYPPPPMRSTSPYQRLSSPETEVYSPRPQSSVRIRLPRDRVVSSLDFSALNSERGVSPSPHLPRSGRSMSSLSTRSAPAFHHLDNDTGGHSDTDDDERRMSTPTTASPLAASTARRIVARPASAASGSPTILIATPRTSAIFDSPRHPKSPGTPLNTRRPGIASPAARSFSARSPSRPFRSSSSML